MDTKYVGLDYSLGRSNFNPETLIHFGVISQNSVNLDVFSEVQMNGADYGKPTCPHCGKGVVSSDGSIEFAEDASELDSDGTPEWFDHKDYTCVACRTCYWSDAVFSDEMLGWSHEADGYKLTGCMDNDIMVLRSPYYTFAQYCSPCVPGAGNLDTPVAGGPKTYALGPEWFDEHSPMPYPCYRVADGVQVTE